MRYINLCLDVQIQFRLIGMPTQQQFHLYDLFSRIRPEVQANLLCCLGRSFHPLFGVVPETGMLLDSCECNSWNTTLPLLILNGGSCPCWRLGAISRISALKLQFVAALTGYGLYRHLLGCTKALNCLEVPWDLKQFRSGWTWQVGMGRRE